MFHVMFLAVLVLFSLALTVNCLYQVFCHLAKKAGGWFMWMMLAAFCAASAVKAIALMFS